MKTLILAVLMCAGVYAQDTELMNTYTVQYNMNRSTMVTGYFRTRLNLSQDAGQFLQVKPGVIVDHVVKVKKYNGYIQAGYYNQADYDSTSDNYNNMHRFFAGPRWYLFNKKNNNNRLENRLLFEQFYTATGVAVHTRVRDRVMWEYLNHKYIPSASYEYLRTQNTNFNRFNFLLRKQVTPKTQVGAGFELRQFPDGQYHRIVWTTFNYVVK